MLPFPWSRNEAAPGFDGSGGEKERQKKFSPEGSAQPPEKAQFGQGNQRKSKLFSLISLARLGPGLARFG
jgi:hypothetical protein